MMAQRLRILSALAEAPGSVSSIPYGSSRLSVTTCPRDGTSPRASGGTRDAPGAHAGKCT